MSQVRQFYCLIESKNNKKNKADYALYNNSSNREELKKKERSAKK